MPEKLPSFEKPLEWAIDRRARVQHLLFKLHCFLEEYSEFPKAEHEQWLQMVRMVDIGFSLWRSAFLTDVKRERETIFAHTKEFVRKVLEHNAITFADDYRMCELTVGYYNSNARYRIERMYAADEDLLQLEPVAEIDRLRKQKNLGGTNQRDLWDKYYLAVMACYEKFHENWLTNVRPTSKPKAAKSRARASSAGGGSKARSPRLGLRQ